MSLLAGLLVGTVAGAAGAEEAGAESAALENRNVESRRELASNDVSSSDLAASRSENRAHTGRGSAARAKNSGRGSTLSGGARAARPEFAAPALYSSSLPLGRLGALPDLPTVIVPRSNMGLDWQQWTAPLGAFEPRETLEGGGVSRARAMGSNPGMIGNAVNAATFGSAANPTSAATTGAPGFRDDSSTAGRSFSSLDRSALDLRPRSSGTSRERTILREWERPQPLPTASSMLIGLDTQHSALLNSLRPERLPGGEAHRDVFRVRPEPVDPRRKALEALGEKMLYRELRRFFRRELKEQFKDDPSLEIDTYLDRRGLIGQLGRGGRAEDLVIEERVTELRNEYLDASEEDPERDIPILQWGPLVLDDRGGVNVDVVDLKERDHKSYSLEFAPDERRVGGYGESVLFPDERYRVSSNLKLNPDLREIGRDWNEAIGKLTASVEIDWRAPVLEDRAFSAELGGSIRADGRYGLYLNFVIYGK